MFLLLVNENAVTDKRDNNFSFDKAGRHDAYKININYFECHSKRKRKLRHIDIRK